MCPPEGHGEVVRGSRGDAAGTHTDPRRAVLMVTSSAREADLGEHVDHAINGPPRVPIAPAPGCCGLRKRSGSGSPAMVADWFAWCCLRPTVPDLRIYA